MLPPGIEPVTFCFRCWFGARGLSSSSVDDEAEENQSDSVTETEDINHKPPRSMYGLE